MTRTDLTPKMASHLNRLRINKANAEANEAPILAWEGGYNLNTIAALRARGFEINERYDRYGASHALA